MAGAEQRVGISGTAVSERHPAQCVANLVHAQSTHKIK
jgi:hypothetical protein